MDEPRVGARWSCASSVDLIAAQIAALDAYNAAAHAADRAAAAASASREMRLDLTRRQQALRLEHQAVVARATAALEDSGRLLTRRVPVRAVLAHRSDWFRDRIADLLLDEGVEVVARLDDGAVAVGTAVAEQPDLVFVEDRLLTLPGEQVIRRVRRFSPATTLAAQALDGSSVLPLVEAGATVVLTRRAKPAEVVEKLLAALPAPA